MKTIFNCLNSFNGTDIFKIPISCFLKDIDPVFEIFEDLQNESRDLSARVFFI